MFPVALSRSSFPFPQQSPPLPLAPASSHHPINLSPREPPAPAPSANGAPGGAPLALMAPLLAPSSAPPQLPPLDNSTFMHRLPVPHGHQQSPHQLPLPAPPPALNSAPPGAPMAPMMAPGATYAPPPPQHSRGAGAAGGFDGAAVRGAHARIPAVHPHLLPQLLPVRRCQRAVFWHGADGDGADGPAGSAVGSAAGSADDGAGSRLRPAGSDAGSSPGTPLGAATTQTTADHRLRHEAGNRRAQPVSHLP